MSRHLFDLIMIVILACVFGTGLGWYHATLDIRKKSTK